MAVGTCAASCLDGSVPAGETMRPVTTSAPISQPWFYFPAMAFGYVVVADPGRLVGHLKVKAAEHPRWYGGLLGQISREMPLVRNADLLDQVFADSFQAAPIQSLLADLLERGDAAVFNIGTGAALKEIVLKREVSAESARRTFLANGSVVFFNVDCVAN